MQVEVPSPSDRVGVDNGEVRMRCEWNKTQNVKFTAMHTVYNFISV